MLIQGPDKNDEYSAIIRANNSISLQCKLFYFEVDIINIGKNGYVIGQIFYITNRINSLKTCFNFIFRIIGVGFCTKEVKLDRMPGNCNFHFLLILI